MSAYALDGLPQKGRMHDMKELALRFAFQRDTKRMYRFEEESEEPVVGSLYVSKGAFEARPARLEVTVRVIE